MNRLLFILSSLLCIFSPYAVPQDGLKGSGNLQIAFDALRFYGDTNHIYVELSYSIRENALTYRHESGQYVGAANMKYVIRNDSGIVAAKE